MARGHAVTDVAPPSLPQDLLDGIAQFGETKSWKKGQRVVAEGDPSDGMYFIRSGELRVYLVGEGGREVELNQLGAGEYFGELMLASTVRTASVRTLSSATLTKVSRSDFERVLSERPDLALLLIQGLIERVRVLSSSVRSLASMDVYGRVVALFDELARESDGVRLVPAPISQQRVANRVGASRSMIHRILHDLCEGGYIEVVPQGIRLLKRLPSRW
jgi:CRP/FNR family transcriptional regulator, cyclic AMP receptor protein